MKTTLLLLAFLIACTSSIRAQYFNQYFDGADTISSQAILPIIDTSYANTWQIGRPHKVIFDSAATLPHALVTDTLLPYPANDSSQVIFKLPVNGNFSNLFALQWKQKLDMDSAKDGGVIEYSADTGRTWQNVFNNSQIHNLYGYAQGSQVQLPGGEWAFSGRDTVWRDIWLCVRRNSVSSDSAFFRFTMRSDSVNNNRDGWMIDNMSFHVTFVHPVKEVDKDPYMKVYPRLTNGTVYIQSKDVDNNAFKIFGAELLDEQGRIVERYSLQSNMAQVDIGNQPNGWYLLKVNTSVKSHSYKIMLKREQ